MNTIYILNTYDDTTYYSSEQYTKALEDFKYWLHHNSLETLKSRKHQHMELIKLENSKYSASWLNGVNVHTCEDSKLCAYMGDNEDGTYGDNSTNTTTIYYIDYDSINNEDVHESLIRVWSPNTLNKYLEFVIDRDSEHWYTDEQFNNWLTKGLEIIKNPDLTSVGNELNDLLYQIGKEYDKWDDENN